MSIIQGMLHKVSTLLILVGLPHKPDCAGKGGRGLGIPLCPSEDVLGLAYSLGDRFARDDNNEAALYFLGIFYELTGDEETGTKIADIVQRSRS